MRTLTRGPYSVRYKGVDCNEFIYLSVYCHIHGTWVQLTWDQPLFSFRFENYIPAGKAKRKEGLIQTFYETSAAHFFDWLTFAESANQNYFRCLFFWYANFSRVEKMQTGWLKK